MSNNNYTNPDNQPNQTPNRRQRQAKKQDDRTDEAGYQKLPPGLRPYAGFAQRAPLDYDSHPYPSMRRFAEFLALRFDAPRTRHSYYRHMRLVHEFCQADPDTITESLLRDYILHVKTVKHWKSKTIRQAAAASKLFFIELMEHEEWRIFSQIRTRDEDGLPAVLTREEVIRLLRHIRLRRYRVPVKIMNAARCTAWMMTGFFRFNGQGDGGLRSTHENSRNILMFRRARTVTAPGDRAKSMPAGAHRPHSMGFHPAQPLLPLDRLQTQNA